MYIRSRIGAAKNDMPENGGKVIDFTVMDQTILPTNGYVFGFL